jgi:tetratricopeptide (TPR) repeat protein
MRGDHKHWAPQRHNKEGLWIISAQVEDFLGNEPKRLLALERAVRENPQSVLSRYLLARSLRRRGRVQEAVATLSDVVRNYPDEFRPTTEYALALYESGESIDTAISVMRLSTLYGNGDPRFLATLGGLLFLSGRFGDANDVFEEGIRRELSFDELQVIRFRPYVPQSTVPYRKTGSIYVARPSYCLVEVPGQPRVFLHASRYRGLVLRTGMTITFDLVFSARGATAENPQLIAT